MNRWPQLHRDVHDRRARSRRTPRTRCRHGMATGLLAGRHVDVHGDDRPERLHRRRRRSLPQYQFTGDGTLDDERRSRARRSRTSPIRRRARHIVKVSEGGSGLCEGELRPLLAPTASTVWLLKPELNADNTITGDGEFGMYAPISGRT